MSVVFDGTEQQPPAVDLDFSQIDPKVKEELEPLKKLDNYHAILGLLLDIAVVAFSVAICTEITWWLYPISAILIGSTHRGLAHYLHESAHEILAKNVKLNLLLGTVFSGYLTMHLLNPYRASHIGLHHRYLGDAENDPDYQFHAELGLYTNKQSTLAFFTQNVLLPLIGFRGLSYMKYIAQHRLFSKETDSGVPMPVSLRTERIVFTLEWALIIGVCAVFGWLPYLLLFWFVPMFTTAVAIGWLAELSEHYPLPESESKKVLLTRNRDGWAIENFLLGRHKERLHQVHHLNTGIPFWNVKKAHKIMLADPAYAAWDHMWAGVFTRRRDQRGKETVLSYAAKYRAWRRGGGDPDELPTSFAELMTRVHSARPAEGR